MKLSNLLAGFLPRATSLSLLTLLAACGSPDSILGARDRVAPVPPSVIAVAPADNATDVSTNLTAASATFDLALESPAGATFSVTCVAPCTSPTGTLSLDAAATTATFTFAPGTVLAPQTLYTATVNGFRNLASGAAMTSPYVWHFTTGLLPDIVPPTVSSTSPVLGAVDVPINASIVASFSEAMNPLSVSSTTFTLACPGGTPITGSVALSSNGIAATFTPAANLPSLTLCTATIGTGAEDVAGNNMLIASSWSFTTGTTVDTTAPTVNTTSPAANATAVALNSLIDATFSEAMDPLTINNLTFTLACPNTTTIAGTVAYAVSGNIATFTPATALPASTLCNASIGTGAQDVAGNPLATAYTWSFTTGTAADTTAPTVISTIPAAAETGVALNTLLSASFSEGMNPLSITTASFTLACPGGTPIAGAVGYSVNGNVATFTPSTALPASVLCTAMITTAAEDAAGNNLAIPHTWSFTTGAAPDLTAPTVSSTTPAANATGVALNAGIEASFSEAMNPLTVTTSTFTLACPSGTPITGSVSYAPTSHVATFTPAIALPANTLCQAGVSTGVRDVAGNAMATVKAWSFTTGATPDVLAPAVTATSPPANATGVAINSLVTATFSEAMDALTVTATSFSLACPAGTPITGTVAYAVSGNVATFTPASALPVTTVCAASVTTAVEDLAGNNMLVAHDWTFTTGAAPDATAPTVTGTNPATGAVGVCVNKTINATFSEPMDPLTITTANFTLAETAGAPLTGVVGYDTATNIATFNPDSNLTGTPATSYTATLKGSPTGVRDLAGNLLAADVVTTFTTNASTCAAAPPLGAAAPFGGMGGTATLTNDGLNTVINGDVGVASSSTSITGLRDSSGAEYTITPLNNGLVNGIIYTMTAPIGSVPGLAVTQALVDAQAASVSISPGVLPGGINMADTAQCPSCGGLLGGADEFAGRTLPPGIYLSALGTFDLSGASRTVGNLTLDAGGDVNAVWIFQTTAGSGTLNVGLTGPSTPAVPISMLLINGANSKNVFWYVPGGATLGTGSTTVGTLLATATVTISTAGTAPLPVITTLHGRAIAFTAAVTLVNTVVNVPAP